LSNLTIPGSVTNPYTDSIGDCFRYCGPLAVNFTGGVVGDSFHSWLTLESVTIGNTVKSVKANAFSGCTSVSTVTIVSPNTVIGSNAFSDCYYLRTVTVPGTFSYDGMPFTSGFFELVVTGESVKSSLFKEWRCISRVVLSDTIASIGSEAFSGCNSLYSVFVNSSIASIGSEAFSNCSSLSSFSYNGLNNPGEISCFTGCTVLTRVFVPCEYKDKYFCGKDIEKAEECPSSSSSLSDHSSSYNLSSCSMARPLAALLILALATIFRFIRY